MIDFGRRKSFYWGAALNILGYLSIAALRFCTDPTWFAILYGILRSLIGVGMSVSYTASLTMLTKLFPTHISWVISLMETLRGIGLVTGPIIGSITYSHAGFSGPHLIFGTIFILYLIVMMRTLPDEVESKAADDNEE